MIQDFSFSVRKIRLISFDALDMMTMLTQVNRVIKRRSNSQLKPRDLDEGEKVLLTETAMRCLGMKKMSIVMYDNLMLHFNSKN